MQRYFAIDKVDNKLILSNDDYHHIKNVMRMKINDNIEVVYDNKLYIANIESYDDIVIKEEKLEYNDIYPEIILIIPALKEQKLDLIFQKSTELGVSSIIVAPFERSMVKYDNRKEKVKLDRWNKICKEASEQSKRVDIPLIKLENNFNFVDSLEGIKLICSTTEKDNYIKKFLKKNEGYDKLILVIGPEGGISPKEEELLVSKGFTRVTLGSQIMRVETVPIFLTSIIRYEYTE